MFTHQLCSNVNQETNEHMDVESSNLLPCILECTILNDLGPIIDGAQGTEAALILRCESITEPSSRSKGMFVSLPQDCIGA